MTLTDSWRLLAGNEWVARDPWGQVKPGDGSARQDAKAAVDKVVRLRAARNGYASFRLWVVGAGRYRLGVEVDCAGVSADVFKAWYHQMAPAKDQSGAGDSPRYFTDALVPVASMVREQLPDPDNAIPGQTHQEYWIDVFVAKDAAVGRATGRAILETSAGRLALPLELEVLADVVPDDEAVVADHNSYGCRWVQALYPGRFVGLTGRARWEKTIEILQHYYRICHEHRGHFSNLGAGHAGSFDPIYGPAARGVGQGKTLEGWELFDRHYGPLLDGSAFAAPSPGAPPARRPPRPVWGVYTPINVAWPADWLAWGQSGYEAEFLAGLRQFDRHFRQRGWLTSRPWLFFNHKKRYRWFEWDGDEPKYSKDDAYYLKVGRLFRQAIEGSPVPWLFRMDASWQMKNNFQRYAGLVDFYVCGGFIKWYPDEVAQVVGRGDVAWSYSGTPGIDGPSSALLEHVFRAWARGLAGHCEWLTVAPGNDPWFACEGASTGMIYPGERFGLPGPIPSARLKMQRNAVQDVTLLDSRAGADRPQVRRKLAAKVPLPLWEKPPPIVRDRPPEEWDSANLSQQPDANMAQYQPLDPMWWLDIRRAALGEVQP